MIQQSNNINFFDEFCKPEEQFPRRFTLYFREVGNSQRGEVIVSFEDNMQLGNTINDNSYKNDFYRYHDIFHYSFAALLGWSPCARAMMRRKRKSDVLIDEIEDGARAAITEEAISMIIFNEAKRKNYFEGATQVTDVTLGIIKEMSENFEVNIRTTKEWEVAILKAYEVFRFLIKNKGGKVEFDTVMKRIKYTSL